MSFIVLCVLCVSKHTSERAISKGAIILCRLRKRLLSDLVLKGLDYGLRQVTEMRLKTKKDALSVLDF